MTPLYRPRPERWLTWRFSLRTLFVLLTIFGVWLGVQVKWIRDRHEMLEWIKCCGSYRYDNPLAGAPGTVLQAAPLSLSIFGEPGIWRITFEQSKVAAIPDEFKARDQSFNALFPEAQIIVIDDE